jgi:serine protease Do
MGRGSLVTTLLPLLLAGPLRAEGSPESRGPQTIEDLKELEKTIVGAARKVLPAMVFIDGGSGVLISPDGYILTNNHVIAEVVESRLKAGVRSGPTQVTVGFTGGSRRRAEVVGRDPGGDIALLKTVDSGPYQYLELGDSDAMRAGQWVLAVGNPFLLGEGVFDFFSGPADASPSVSLGVVSALHRSSELYPDAIQFDVAVNPGSSGGPLLDTQARVVGITGKIQTRFFVEVNSGVGYAVPANQIARFLDSLKRAGGGVVRRGEILGLSLAERGDSDLGLGVVRVTRGSPGERAGFQTGDHILEIDGHPIWSKRRYSGLLATYPAGSHVAVRVSRGEKREELTAILDPNAPAWLGIQAEAGGTGRGGVRLSEVMRDGPAAKAGLKPGDIIQKFDGRRLESVVDLIEAIRERQAGDTATLGVLRGEREEEIQARLGARPEE